MCDAKFSLWKNTGSGFVGFDTFVKVHMLATTKQTEVSSC